MTIRIAAPKPDGSRRQSEKKTILNHFLKGILQGKSPLQYDLRCPAAKDNNITHAAAARSNLDAAITMRSPDTELQNTKELRATASEIVAQNTEEEPKRPQPHPPQITRYLSPPAATTLHRKNTRFRAPASSPLPP